ncbi:MAG: baseplate J/gp47 family protein [Paraclostridium sp.]
MFDNYTYEYLISEMMNRIPDTFDKREGSIIFNAVAPVAAELAEVYVMLSLILDESFVDTMSYNNLVKRCKERGLTPLPATNAIGKGVFNIDVPIGARFNLGDYNYIVIDKISDLTFKLECEDTGRINLTGTLIPIDYIDGLETAQLTEILIHGEDEEDEDALRDRYYRSLDAEAFGGNIADYKEKVNKINDVGGVKVYPTWQGGGSTKLVILNSLYGVPSSELVNTVQEIIDPIQNQGKGLGIAPIGHTVTVEGAKGISINISADIVYQRDWNFEEIRISFEEMIDTYFEQLNTDWENKDNVVVRLSQIETRLLDLEGVADVMSVTVNGTQSNYILDENSIAIRGEING